MGSGCVLTGAAEGQSVGDDDGPVRDFDGEAHRSGRRHLRTVASLDGAHEGRESTLAPVRARCGRRQP